MEKQVVQFQFGGQDVTLETGAVARQVMAFAFFPDFFGNKLLLFVVDFFSEQ